MTTQSRLSTASALVVLGLLSIGGCALENRIVTVPKSLASTPRAGLAKLKTFGGCINTAIDAESFDVVHGSNTGWTGILPGRHTISTGLKASHETRAYPSSPTKTVETFSSVLPQSVTFEAVSGREYMLACEVIDLKEWLALNDSINWQVVIYDCTEGGNGLLMWDTSKMKLIAKSGAPED